MELPFCSIRVSSCCLEELEEYDWLGLNTCGNELLHILRFFFFGKWWLLKVSSTAPKVSKLWWGLRKIILYSKIPSQVEGIIWFQSDALHQHYSWYSISSYLVLSHSNWHRKFSKGIKCCSVLLSMSCSSKISGTAYVQFKCAFWW